MSRRWLMGLLGLLVGCGGGPSPTGSQTTLIFGRGNDSVTLDPADAEDGESAKIINNVFDTLVTYADDSSRIVPSLATSWQESDDRRSWTFTLREGVTFHDGTPFGPDAVKFTFERILDPDHPGNHGLKAPYRQDYAIIEEIASAASNEVTFKLKRPSGVFLANLATFSASIVSPSAVTEHAERFSVHPVGTGPFRFEEWIPEVKLTLAANEKYWGGAPGVERVIFKPIPEPTARLRQLRTGEIDMADGLTIPVRAEVRQDDSLKLLRVPGMNTAYFAMNNQRPPFNDVRVRRALGHAIDKEALVKSVYEGEAVIATSLIPPPMFAFNEHWKGIDYDPKRSRQLLEEAGVAKGTSFRLWVMPNSRPYMPAPDRVAAMIQEQLRQVGLEPEIHSPPWSQFLEQTGNGEHETALFGWITDNGDPDNFLFALLDKTNAEPPLARNVAFYLSEPVHELLLNAQQESDPDKRAQLYDQAQRLIDEDCPVVPLVHVDLAMALRANVKGYVINPVGIVRLKGVTVESGSK
ncbi:Periplasmic dipeptide transport protein precursor [Planctomycetes bacterium Pan216]|uniref:Periplasmic dipeptide transport protein n=1 Tax=Kolteria novifilia TaxID=2527975 RepID=A0A518AXI4_9BACT|nr:Periplasmic dipeptide transport protein precursor [Planctomycetes bacterium Pan216]